MTAFVALLLLGGLVVGCAVEPPRAPPASAPYPRITASGKIAPCFDDPADGHAPFFGCWP